MPCWYEDRGDYGTGATVSEARAQATAGLPDAITQAVTNVDEMLAASDRALHAGYLGERHNLARAGRAQPWFRSLWSLLRNAISASRGRESVA